MKIMISYNPISHTSDTSIQEIMYTPLGSRKTSHSVCYLIFTQYYRANTKAVWAVSETDIMLLKMLNNRVKSTRVWTEDKAFETPARPEKNQWDKI